MGLQHTSIRWRKNTENTTFVRTFHFNDTIQGWRVGIVTFLVSRNQVAEPGVGYFSIQESFDN